MHGALVLTDFTEFHFVCHDLIVAGRCSFPSASPAQDALFSSLPSLVSLSHSHSLSRLLASFFTGQFSAAFCLRHPAAA